MQLETLGAMVHWKEPPSSDTWTCVHGVGYPDLCEGCLREDVKSYKN